MYSVCSICLGVKTVLHIFSFFKKFKCDLFKEGIRKDILVLLTDGVTESRNAAGEMFGIERVEEVLRRSENAERFIERLKAVLKEFCGTFDDDITAIAFDL